MTVEPFWDAINASVLRQGDYLPGCLVPTFGPDLSVAETLEIVTDEFDLILVTQSCDLEQRRVRLVAACPVFSVIEFERANPVFTKKGRWNEVL